VAVSNGRKIAAAVLVVLAAVLARNYFLTLRDGGTIKSPSDLAYEKPIPIRTEAERADVRERQRLAKESLIGHPIPNASNGGMPRFDGKTPDDNGNETLARETDESEK
jgi:hypothetical protein